MEKDGKGPDVCLRGSVGCTTFVSIGEDPRPQFDSDIRVDFLKAHQKRSGLRNESSRVGKGAVQV